MYSSTSGKGPPSSGWATNVVIAPSPVSIRTSRSAIAAPSSIVARLLLPAPAGAPSRARPHVTGVGVTGVERQERAPPIRREPGQPARDEAAPREADERDAREPELIEQAHHEPGELRRPEALDVERRRLPEPRRRDR